MSSTPFDYLHHLVVVPVTANGSLESRFVLDSGIGLTIVSEALGEAIGAEPAGSSFTGRRMSGQEVTVPLAAAPSLSLGGLVREEVEVGVLDLSGFPPELQEIGGFVSLAFFGETPFTVDYPNRVVTLETPETLAGRAEAGEAVDVRVERDGPSMTVFLPLTLPGGRSIEVEVDMGSDALILDEELAAEVGVRLDGPEVRRVEGTDETGHAYVRSFTRLSGAIHPGGAPALTHADPDVMFQRLMYEGLVGDSFLRRFAVTYDLARERLIFGRA